MSLPPRVVAVVDASPADRAGIVAGDEIVAINGRSPRDVIEYQLIADEAYLDLELRRGPAERRVIVSKDQGAPLGIEVSSPVFDRVQTCDNHCEFCFIYQLPKGMRRSLYLKDDDYRLSFLYGNFTTLTRFTEADLERVVTERLAPLFVSIHATDPTTRARLLRNPRGATSLRWLRALLDHDIEVHGQVVVCPGVNDGPVLEETLAGVLDRYPELASVALVPLGVSRHSHEPAMRPHSPDEAAAVIDVVEAWQELALAALGRRLFFPGDEYFLLAGRPFPSVEVYEGVPQHENGVGMVASFVAAFWGDEGAARGKKPGFFSAVEGAPAAGYRAARVARGCGSSERAACAPRQQATLGAARRGTRGAASTGIVTGEYGAEVLRPLLEGLDRADIRVVTVANRFFGGNIAVAGLLAGQDIGRALADEPETDRYLIPDACLSGGRFVDGLGPEDMPRPVEVVASDGASLRRALGEVLVR